jgi:hypothetical protein
MIKMNEQKKKTAAQEMRDLHEEIRKSLKPSKELIDDLIKTGKVKRKDESDKKDARLLNLEVGA